MKVVPSEYWNTDKAQFWTASTGLLEWPDQLPSNWNEMHHRVCFIARDEFTSWLESQFAPTDSKSSARMGRPEHAPRGYEWLPQAFERVGKSPKNQDAIRRALAEGDVVAILRGPLGDRYEIPKRMWDKEPLKKKVLPRFEDGWMRFNLDFGNPVPHRYVNGHVFVPEGSLLSIVSLTDGNAQLPPRRPNAGRAVATYEYADEALVKEMDARIRNSVPGTMTPWRAALDLAAKARGGGTVESKAKRLARRYKRSLVASQR